MKPLMLLLLLLLTTTLVSCGQQGKTSAKLEVSQSFLVDSSKFGGGLIITGESSTGKKFTIALDNSRSASAELDQGNWTFTAVAWDGGANNFKFEGTYYCGLTQANLNSTEANVSISVSNSNCTNTDFAAKAPIKFIRPLACGAFYSYAQSTNTFTAVNSSTPNNFCEDGATSKVPDEILNQHFYYRIIAAQGDNTAANSGFESECKGISVNQLYLPSKTIPLFIRLYKTSSDCTSKIVNTPVYHFPNGLEAGNPNKFDLEFHDQTAPNARVVLPTSVTKRGRSPFIDMVPRILCGATSPFSDCLPDPTYTSVPNAEDVLVSFKEERGREQMILKDVGPNATCPSTLLTSMQYFSASDCEIRDGNAFAKFHRNQLTCQDSGEYTSAKDIYFANNKFYVLRHNGPNSEIAVMNDKGKEISRIQYSSVLLKSIAVDNNGNIYSHDLTDLIKFSYNSSSQSYAAQTPVSTAYVQLKHIDVSPDGSLLFASGITNILFGTADIKAYSTSNLSIPSTSYSLPTSTNVVQIQYIPGSPNYLTYGESGAIKKIVWNGTFGTASTIGTTSGLFSYYISSGDIYYGTSSSLTRTDSSFTLKSSTSISAGSGAIAVKDSLLYAVIQTSGSSLKVYTTPGSTGSPGTMVASYQNGANCAEPSTNTSVTIAGKSKVLNVHALFNDSVYRLWESGFEFLGRRNVTVNDARYYFKELTPHGDEISNGGYLRRAQQMLMPNGVAGLFSDFATCGDLLTAATNAGSAGISRAQTLYDPASATFATYGVTAKVYNTVIEPYLCQDGNSAGTCNNTVDKYSLELSFGELYTSDTDKSVMRISCSRKLGTMETLEVSDG